MPGRLEGLIAAVHTPMHPDTSLNLAAVDRLAEAMGRSRMRGVFVCGTAGEGQALTVAERMQVLERWVRVAAKDLLVIAHVGSNCVPDARALAAHAEKAGAAAVASVAPSFDTPDRADDLVAFCAAIAEAAPRTPFYYYHLPAKTNLKVQAAAFFERAIGRIPTLGGIKFTDSNLTDFGDCIALAGAERSALFGRTEFLLSGLVLGAHGSIGGPYNFAAPLFVRLTEAFERGDRKEARRLQDRARRLGTITKRFGGLSALKAATAMVGLDCGPVRLPRRRLTPDEITGLRADLEREGFFDDFLKAG
jgi:N-acetylneuraminate lyase